MFGLFSQRYFDLHESKKQISIEINDWNISVISCILRRLEGSIKKDFEMSVNECYYKNGKKLYK